MLTYQISPNLAAKQRPRLLSNVKFTPKKRILPCTNASIFDMMYSNHEVGLCIYCTMYSKLDGT